MQFEEAEEICCPLPLPPLQRPIGVALISANHQDLLSRLAACLRQRKRLRNFLPATIASCLSTLRHQCSNVRCECLFAPSRQCSNVCSLCLFAPSRQGSNVCSLCRFASRPSDTDPECGISTCIDSFVLPPILLTISRIILITCRAPLQQISYTPQKRIHNESNTLEAVTTTGHTRYKSKSTTSRTHSKQ